MFMAHDSRRGTPGQLVGGTVEVQVADDLDWLILNPENSKLVGQSQKPPPSKNQRRKDGPTPMRLNSS
jgi:hypothetical protein